MKRPSTRPEDVALGTILFFAFVALWVEVLLQIAQALAR